MLFFLKPNNINLQGIVMEEGNYFTASKKLSLTVTHGDSEILFRIDGGERVERKVSKVFLPNIVGALDLLGLGLWTGREVCDGVYFENGKKLGYVRIRIRKVENEKIFIEIPNFEAGAISKFLLNKLTNYFLYSYLNIYMKAEKEAKYVTLNFKVSDGRKTVILDADSGNRLTSAIRAAVLGRLTHRMKITGRKGYVVIGDYFKTEDPKLQNQVDEAISKLRKFCDKEGIFPSPFIRKILNEKNISFKTYITFRIGEGSQKEDRAYIFLPLPHAWGIAECLNRLIPQ